MSLLINDRIRIVYLLSTKTLSGSLIEIAGKPVRDDNAYEQMNRFIRRCRFIAHTADLSALGGCSNISIKKFICIIGPWWITWAVQWLHASFVCTITFGIAWPVGHEKEGGDERQYV